ncbi:MAG TPA: NAD+ synthase [Gemmatimonadaceae bacterium]|nr:NAD+ synthase [Gemmatimonadaceae bacterium]
MPPLVHLALAQIKPAKGDYAANLARLGEVFAQVNGMRPRPQVLHLPETALTGYFVEGGVRDLAVTAGTLARDLQETWRGATNGLSTLDVVVGFYEIFQNTLFNSAMYVTLGPERPDVLHVHRKVFLPTYGLFDEERFVERGHEFHAFDTSWGRAAILVCEDAWHSLSATLAALDGAQVIFVSSAAPARGAWPRDDAIPGPASVARWERLIRDIAEEHGVFVSFANLAGSEGGKIFSGASLITGPKGDIRTRAPLWDEALVTLPLDLADLTRARADMPLLADLRTAMPHLMERLTAKEPREPPPLAFDPPSENGNHALVHPDAEPPASGPLRVVQVAPLEGAGGPPPLDIDGELTEKWLVHFIQEEVQRRGFSKGIIGVSGGVDSAVTAYLAARALGPENVIGVRLPYSTSSTESLEHAQLVIDALGITGRTLDISPAVDGYLSAEADASPGRRGNVMARVRMIALFDLSSKYQAIPLGTGNKTERLFGYFTWHADDSPPVNPLGDLFKTQVWQLARHLGVPQPIVEKPATADLVHGQTDEGDLGITYEKADRILQWLLSGYAPAELVSRGFEAKEVELVRQRLEGTHWKRRLPTVAMVSPNAIGESYLRPVDY